MRSPFVYGRNTAECADLIASLLDELNISEVAALTISGGGPTGIHFAARHPDKCKALLMVCSVTGSWKHPRLDLVRSPFLRFFMTSITMARLMGWVSKAYPKMLIKGFFDEMASYTPEEAEKASEHILNNASKLKSC
jgi:pimeloyl-ACP methyl ester carboxylesterase